ncbi:MAG: LPXTG cell wall anchor domain-containing protein [Eubacterium sp.]|nr:LPXTG cell wall anchor domain-containing protein [Eubacterium sp.]
MYNTSHKNKYHRKSLPVVLALILAICVFVSFIVLSNYLRVYAREEIRTDIDLLSVSSASVEQAHSSSNSYETTGSSIPGFNISDNDQTWESSTEINIFKVSYQNGDKVVTALSQNGDKIIAPGIANDYSFVLNNTGNTAVDYTMSVEAYISDNITSIPVQVKLKDYTGRYLVGSENEWQSVLDLNNISDSASLAAGYHTTYTLGWQWPFESNDEFDTQIGNLAEGEDITLTIAIKTIASADADDSADTNNGAGQPPKTGDNFNILIWSVLAAASLFVMILLIFFKRREKEEDSADAA